jgi:hypothetical protein
MEQVLQKTIKIRHVSNLKWLEHPKIDLEEVATFHSEEQDKLEDFIKNIEPKTIWSIENHLLKLWRIKTNPKISR